jgi:hypothetical protein
MPEGARKYPDAAIPDTACAIAHYGRGKGRYPAAVPWTPGAASDGVTTVLGNPWRACSRCDAMPLVSSQPPGTCCGAGQPVRRPDPGGRADARAGRGGDQGWHWVMNGRQRTAAPPFRSCPADPRRRGPAPGRRPHSPRSTRRALAPPCPAATGSPPACTKTYRTCPNSVRSGDAQFTTAATVASWFFRAAAGTVQMMILATVKRYGCS